MSDYTNHAGIKDVLSRMLTQLEHLSRVVEPGHSHPDFDAMRYVVQALPTQSLPPHVPYHNLINVPQALLPSFMVSNVTQFEWMIACYYAEKRPRSVTGGTKPTDQDIEDAKRVATIVAFLGA